MNRYITSLSFVCLCAFATAGHSATMWWNGAENNNGNSGRGWAMTTAWSTASNATTPYSGSVPGSGDNVIFNISAITSSQTVDLNANQSVSGMTFNSSGGVNIVSGAGTNTLSIGTGGITVNSGAGAAQISTTASLAGNQQWYVAAQSSLSFNSLVVTSTATTAIKTGLGQVKFGGNTNNTGPSPSNFTIDVEQGRFVLDQSTSFLPNMGFIFNGGSYFNTWSQGSANNLLNITIGAAGVQWEAPLNTLDFSSNGNAAYVYQGGSSSAPVTIMKSGYSAMYFGTNSSSQSSSTNYQGNAYFNFLGIGGLYDVAQDKTGRTSQVYNTELIGGSLRVYSASQLANGTSSKIRIINSAASGAMFAGAQDGTGLSGGVFSFTNMKNMISADSNGTVVLPKNTDTDNWNMAQIGNGLMFLTGQATTAGSSPFQGTLSPDSDNTYRLGGNSWVANQGEANSNSVGLNVQTATLAAGNNLIVGSGLAGSQGSVWLQQNSSAFNGSVTINGDNISSAVGYNRMILNLTSSGALPNASSYTINASAEIYLDNTNGVSASNRLSSTAPITMEDGSKLVLTTSSNVTSTQSVGPITADGFSTLRVTFNGSAGPVLTASNASTQNGGVFVFENGNSAGGSGTLGTASGGEIRLTGLNGTAITADVPFMGGAFVAGNGIDPSGNTRSNYTWAKYNFTDGTGVHAFSGSDYSANSNSETLWSSAGTDNVDLTASVSLSANRTINSLRFDTSGALTVNTGFQLSVGAIMSAVTAGTILGSGTLTSATGSLYFHNNKGTSTINPLLTGNLNLVITEDEPLGQNGDSFVLANAGNNFVGSIYVNGASVTYTNDNRWGPTSNQMNLNGAVLVGSSNPTVNRQINILKGGAVLSNGGNMTFAGKVSGSGNIIIPFSETAIFSNSSNDFSGIVTVQGPGNTSGESSSAIVRTGAANALGSNAAYVLQADSTLDLTNNGANAGYSQAIGSLEDSGRVNLGSATLTVGGRNTETVYMGTMYGSGGMVKTGSAAWVLGGVQQYTGATNINSGTLRLYTDGGAYNSSHNAGNLALSSTISVSSGATLDVSAYNNLSPQFTVGDPSTNSQLLTGGGTVAGNMTIGSLGSLDPGAMTVTGSLTLAGGAILNSSGTGTVASPGYLVQSGSAAAGLLGASAGLIKSTTGTATLSGANTYGGGTAINAGTLKVSQTASLPGYASSGTVSVANGATLALSVGGSGQFQASDVTSVLGNVTFSATSYLGFDASGAAGAFTVADNITSPNLGLVKLGGGAVLLTGSNTYPGGSTISGGTLQLGSNSALGSGNLTANAGVLDLGGYSTSVTSFSGAAGVVTNSNSAAATLTVNQSAATNFSGSLRDGVGQTALYLSAGTLTLSGSNNYSGGTTINSGLLKVNNDFAIGPGSLAGSGGTLDMNGYGASISTLNGNVTIGNGATGASNFATVTVNNGGSFSGTIVDGVGTGNAPTALVVAGGTLTLNASSPFSKGLTIAAGALVLGNAVSLSGTGAANLNGGVLANSGTSSIAGIVTSGGGAHTIAPGGFGQYGQLNVGGLLLNGNSTLNFDLSTGQQDLIVDSGTLSVPTGTVNIQVTGGLTAAGTYPLIEFNSTSLADTSSFSLSPISGSTSGYSLSLVNTGGSQQLDLVIQSLLANSTSYSLAVSPGTAQSIHVASASTFASLALTGSISNTGTSGDSSDQLVFSGFGLSASGGTLSGGTLPVSSGTLNVSSGTSGTATFSSNTAGSYSITPTASGIGNLVATGSSPTLSGSNTTTVNVYNLAAPSTPSLVTLTTIHAGDSFASVPITVGNSAAAGGFSEGLDVTVVGSGGSATNSGGPIINLSAGSSDSSSISVGLAASLGGSVSGTVTLSMSSNGSTTSGLSATALTSAVVNVVGTVFSGTGVWTGASGSWGIASNWQGGAAPGSFAGYLNTDTAAFSGSGSATAVDLTGLNVGLKKLVFSTSDYSLSNGTVTVASNDSSTPEIDVLDGTTQTIDSVLAGSQGLTLVGPGTLVLGNSANSFSGDTDVASGTLILQDSGSLIDGMNLTVGDSSGFAPALTVPSRGQAVELAPVPEPGAMALLAAGLACAAACFNRRRKGSPKDCHKE